MIKKITLNDFLDSNNGDKILTYNDYTIKISPDSDPQSPDKIGDDEIFLTADNREFCTKTKDPINPDNYHIFPVEAYIHGGIALALQNTGNFPDRQWDVASSFASIYISKDVAKTFDKAKDLASGLIDEWNDYLSGNVYGFTISDPSGNIIESIWGFYGDVHKSGIFDEIRSILDNLPAIKDNRAYIADNINKNLDNIADILADYSTNKDFNTSILRNLKSIKTILKTS